MRESALIDLRRLIGVATTRSIELADALDAARARRRRLGERRRRSTSSSEALDAAARAQGADACAWAAPRRAQQAALTATKPTVAVRRRRRLREAEPAHLPAPGRVAGVVGRRRQRQLDVLRLRPRQVAGGRGRGRGRARRASGSRSSTRSCRADVRQRLLDLESSQAMVRAPQPTRSAAPPRPAASSAIDSAPAWRPAPTCSSRRWRCSRPSWRARARSPACGSPKRGSSASLGTTVTSDATSRHRRARADAHASATSSPSTTCRSP